MKTCLYVRVSTQEQALNGNSLGEQKERAKAYCQAKGWELSEIYEDAGFSGGNMNRPALQKMLNDCTKYNMVLVYKLDRLSRSQKDTMHIIEDILLVNGVQFSSMNENFDTSTPLGMAMVGILSVFAQLERAQIAERMSMGRAAIVKKGYWHGGALPLGYMYGNNKELVLDEDAPVLRKAFEMIKDGYSLQQTRYTLENEFKHKSSAQHLSRALRNPIYIGKMRWHGELVDGNHEHLVSNDLFYTVQAKLSENSDLQPNKKPFRVSTHLLSGFLYCAYCGHRVSIHSVKHRIGSKYGYYDCSAKFRKDLLAKTDKRCEFKSIREDKLHELVIEQILALDFEKLPTKKTAPAAKNYSKEIEKIDKQISKLLDAYALDNIDFSMLDAKIKALNDKKDKYTALNNEKPQIVDFQPIIDIKDNIAEIMQGNDINEQRRIVNALVDRIIVENDSIEIHWRF